MRYAGFENLVDELPDNVGIFYIGAISDAAPLNLEYRRAGNVLPFPFHFLHNNHAMNVKPKNYSWTEFHVNVIDLTKYTFTRFIPQVLPPIAQLIRVG
jgi:hypothetical protein